MPPIHLYPVTVIHPGNPKGDLPLGLNDPPQNVLFFVSWMGLKHRVQSLKDFLYGLVKLWLSRKALFKPLEGARNVGHGWALLLGERGMACGHTAWNKDRQRW